MNESILTTDKQKGLVVCMKVYLLQRIRRAWSCVCKYTYYRESKWQKYTYYRESEGFGRMYERILTTENQKGLVVCMNVYLLQRIRRAWSCV